MKRDDLRANESHSNLKGIYMNMGKPDGYAQQDMPPQPRTNATVRLAKKSAAIEGPATRPSVRDWAVGTKGPKSRPAWGKNTSV